MKAAAKEPVPKTPTLRATMSMGDHRLAQQFLWFKLALTVLTFLATYISIANVPIALAIRLKPTNIALNIFSRHLLVMIDECPIKYKDSYDLFIIIMNN